MSDRDNRVNTKVRTKVREDYVYGSAAQKREIVPTSTAKVAKKLAPRKKTRKKFSERDYKTRGSVGEFKSKEQ